jgi:phage host-nuclease inhibitor protein Gam
MNKLSITFFLLFLSFFAFSQTSDTLAVRQLQQSVKRLQTEISNQQTEMKSQQRDFSKQLSAVNDSIHALQASVAAEQANIATLADSLGIKIANNQTKATQQIQNVQQTVSRSTLYWIIAVLAIALLSVLLFVWLRRKQQSDKTDMVARLSQTKQQIDEKLVNEFAKNTEVLETLSQMSKPSQTVEPDHSLALKVAGEINLMERNISLMDKGTRGLKQLERSIEKLKDNLSANGYEIPVLLGKQFHEGMKVIVANSIQDENLEKGSEIISKVLIPQVNYNGVMIQTAQIEVNVGV